MRHRLSRHHLLIPSLVLTVLLGLPGLVSCGQESDSQAGPSDQAGSSAPGSQASPGTGSEESSGTEAGAASASESDAVDLSGKTIAIDPGHNGGNSSHLSQINKPVPDGRGGTKACNTTGTSTNSDYPEADFTWAVAKKLAKKLKAAGAKVVLSRNDNTGVGPCVDERGTFADDADLLVSIHADGSESSAVKGFHIIVADPGTDTKTEKASVSLAKSLGTSMGRTFTPNKAYGKDAISRRPDLAGLNNASVPAVIVECGEMRNPTEAKLMESKSGRSKYAAALFDGIVDWF